MLDQVVPMRLINGASDPVSGRHAAARYQALVPGADVVLLEGVGHYPHVEAPGDVLAAVWDFFNLITERRQRAQRLKKVAVGGEVHVKMVVVRLIVIRREHNIKNVLQVHPLGDVVQKLRRKRDWVGGVVFPVADKGVVLPRRIHKTVNINGVAVGVARERCGTANKPAIKRPDMQNIGDLVALCVSDNWCSDSASPHAIGIGCGVSSL